MKSKNELTRRSFFKIGLGTLGTFAATQSLADACKVSTGAQPLGPFFPSDGTPETPIRELEDPDLPIYLANDNDLTFVKGKKGTADGQIVYIGGKVLDEDCNPIAGATIIAWQASSSGRYNHVGDGNNEDFVHPMTGKTITRELDPYFQYWGKATSDKNGEYIFKTVVPGFYPADLAGGWYRPPHIHMLVSARGKNQFVTQMYFKGAKIKDNDWNQELNRKDLLLDNPSLSDAQRELLVVDFSKNEDPSFSDGLFGTFDISMP